MDLSTGDQKRKYGPDPSQGGPASSIGRAIVGAFEILSTGDQNRKRGRPRKNGSDPSQGGSASPMRKSTGMDLSTGDQKRKRGRPRKNGLDPSQGGSASSTGKKARGRPPAGSTNKKQKTEATVPPPQLAPYFAPDNSDMELGLGLRTIAVRPPRRRGDLPTAADPTGLCTPFFHMFWFENKDHVDDSEFYPDTFESRFLDHLMGAQKPKPNTRQLVDRFLKQVRESGGYDVDCVPPFIFKTPFTPLDEEKREQYRRCDPKLCESYVDGPITFAIHQINAETGHNYKLVDIVRVVAAFAHFFVFLTFTASDVDGDVKTFRALVEIELWDEKYELLEWKIMDKKNNWRRFH